MGFLKRMLGDESDLINELCSHLKKIGLNASILESQSVGTQTFGGLGTVKIEGQNIEYVLVTKHTYPKRTPKGKASTGSYYRYGYGRKGSVEGLQDKLEARAKPIRKSFFNRTIVDYTWEGGELTKLLNADMDLKRMLIEEGINNLWTNASKNLQYVWITRQGDRKEFPTQKTFETYNRIMQNILTLASARAWSSSCYPHIEGV